MGTGPLAFIFYRVIVPDQGLDKSGGVGVPAVNLLAGNGSVRQLQPSFASAESSFGNMIPILAASGFSEAAAYLQQVLAIANLRTSLVGTCTTSQDSRPP